MAFPKPTLVFPLADDPQQRFKDKMTTLMLAELDAKTRFKRCAARGAGRTAEGLDLLNKAAKAAPKATDA